jgi:hypothetical protein|tara:strand:+ start:8968 stop:9348 length:381 start_codon:yes stop_codon:yes gene_type:complete
MSNDIVEQLTNKQEFIDKIQKWVIVDSQLKIVNDKTKQMREMKSQLNNQICNYMNQNNLENNKIGISDGELRLHEKKDYSSITFGYIEQCLAKLISDKKQVDYIIKYLKDNREITMNTEIKRTYKK